MGSYPSHHAPCSGFLCVYSLFIRSNAFPFLYSNVLVTAEFWLEDKLLLELQLFQCVHANLGVPLSCCIGDSCLISYSRNLLKCLLIIPSPILLVSLWFPHFLEVSCKRPLLLNLLVLVISYMNIAFTSFSFLLLPLQLLLCLPPLPSNSWLLLYLLLLHVCVCVCVQLTEPSYCYSYGHVPTNMPM